MDPSLERLILALLRSHNNLTLATLRPDGWPQATTVGYVNDRLTIYFGCAPDSQKAANIRRDGRVSLAIDWDEPDRSRIQGLSMAAITEIVTAAEEIGRIVSLMRAKFPQIAALPPFSPEDLALVRLWPRVVSVLDYTKGFGHTDLVEP
jgi:general stress protein 26